MTDHQLLDVFLKRAAKAGKTYSIALKNPKIVITQQYGKKLYFAIVFEGSTNPHWIMFSNDKQFKVFSLPELPERLMDWKRDVMRQINAVPKLNYIDFDIDNAPKEIVHIFFSAIILALNSPGMSTGLTSIVGLSVFGPNETYEEVQIEADLAGFEGL